MNKDFKLKIELVPSTVWYSSIFQIYKKENKMDKWAEIKKELFEKEGEKCWICEKKNIRLEAHEFWEYDDKKHIQKLKEIHHLCDLCHKIKHIGFWCYTSDGQEQLRKFKLTKENLVNHFCKINKCLREEFEEHKKEAFNIWKERSKYKWKQDFGRYNVTDNYSLSKWTQK